MTEQTAAAPGWYPDPQQPGQQRYWDGTQWTPQVPLQQPAKKGLGTGAIVALAVGIPVLVIVLGIVAAVAIPLFLSQQGAAEDAAARADVSSLGREIATYYVDQSGPLTIRSDGESYLIDSENFSGGLTQSASVEFGGFNSTGATDWCVWVTAPAGDVQDFSYSAARGLQDGRC